MIDDVLKLVSRRKEFCGIDKVLLVAARSSAASIKSCACSRHNCRISAALVERFSVSVMIVIAMPCFFIACCFGMVRRVSQHQCI
jgi:hypothetical protein